MEYGESGIGLIPVQLSGVFPDVSANRVGEYSALIACVALARLLPVPGWKRKLTSWYSWLFLAAFTTMIFAQTRSAILGFCVGVFFIFLFSGRVRLGTAIVVGSVMLIVITGSGHILYDYLRRGQTPAEMATLTGRLQWWEFAWKKFMDAPLTGFGAWAAGRFLVMGAIGNNIGSMHSDWVEVMVGCGFAGIIPLVAAMALGWYKLIQGVLDYALSPLERQLALEAIAVFSVVSTRTIFSTDLTWHAPLSFWIPLGFAEYLRRRYLVTETYRTYPVYASRQFGPSAG
jgi:O-antigen ligase